MRKYPGFVLFSALIIVSAVFADNADQKEIEVKAIDLSLFSDGIHHWDILSTVRECERLDPDNIDLIAKQFLKFQNPDGGLPNEVLKLYEDWYQD